MADTHALDLFFGTDRSKGVEKVVTDLLPCRPTSHDEGALSLEGSGNSWIKDTKSPCKSLIIFSTRHKGP